MVHQSDFTRGPFGKRTERKRDTLMSDTVWKLLSIVALFGVALYWFVHSMPVCDRGPIDKPKISGWPPHWVCQMPEGIPGTYRWKSYIP